MLLTIPRIIPPDFLHALNLMGHTDEVVIADSNFPGHAIARHTAWQVPIFAPGVGVPEMLSAVLQLIPLDYAMKQSLIGMLARKGYPQGLSYRVVRDELRDAGAETTLLDDVDT